MLAAARPGAAPPRAAAEIPSGHARESGRGLASSRRPLDRRAYSQFCANCHGASERGDGNGGAAGPPPADLTDATWDYGSTDGEIFGVIHDGTGRTWAATPSG